MAPRPKIPLFVEDPDPALLENLQQMAAAAGVELDLRSRASVGNPSAAQSGPRDQESNPMVEASRFAWKKLAESCKNREEILKRDSGTQRAKVSRQFIRSKFPKSLTTKSAGAGPKPIEAILVDIPYPPCFRSLDELQPIDLSDLTIESHHEGRVLLAKLTKVLETTNTTTTAEIEDSNGDVECLKVSFVGMSSSEAGHEWPVSGSWLAIKEPYLTVDEHRTTLACIRIDHPFDLVDFDTIRRSNLRDTPSFKLMAVKAPRTRTPLKCKEHGNAALKAGGNKSFLEAEAHYTQGLRLLSERVSSDQANSDLEQDLHRNRAYVRIMLGMHEAAVKDAVEAISHQPDDKHVKLDAKAYSRAGNASYALRRFNDAASYFEEQNKLVPEYSCTQMLAETQQRLLEREAGAYDFASLVQSASQTPRMDVADYLVNTKIGMSTLGKDGCRGLFATRDLQPGELVSAENPYSAVWAHDERELYIPKWNAREADRMEAMRVGSIDMWRQTVQNAGRNPGFASQMLDLHGDYKGARQDVPSVDGKSVVDTYQVHDIVARNSFSLENKGSGLFIRASYINHSCLPNSKRTFLGDFIMVRAVKPISKGEEITISYCDFDAKDFKSRSEKISGVWKFDCTCPICTAERNEPAHLREEREKLVTRATTFTNDGDLEKYESKILVQLVESLCRDIDATYDVPLYENLPRPRLAGLRLWFFLGTNAIDQDPVKAKQAAINMLRTCGFIVESSDSGETRVSATANSVSIYGPATEGMIEALVRTAVTFRKRGDAHVADNLIEFTKSMERVFCGPNDEIVARCLKEDARGKFKMWMNDAEQKSQREKERKFNEKCFAALDYMGKQ